MPKIVAHTIVKNESRWIWYTLQSALPFVDEIIIGNHGSTDNTLEIITSINSSKIKIQDYSHIPDNNYSGIRTAMMQTTKADWLLILDGDEIWPASAMKNSLRMIKENSNLDFLVQPFYNLVGDVYHFQPESAGKYQICGYQGHVTLRFINVKKLGGLLFQGAHMQQGMYTPQGNLIQNIPNPNFIYQPIKYFHTTHLLRSYVDYQVQKRSAKFKYESGICFPKNFEFPEVFYKPHPLIVKDIWEYRSFGYNLNALWQTPLRQIHRLMTQ